MNDIYPGLEAVLVEIGNAAIAVSGGIDSLTLMTAAKRCTNPVAFHAISPAVPVAATARTRALARLQHWTLRVIDAGELNDPNYVKNPVNRCFFCKTNLYATIAQHHPGQILSGANLDDLSDYRPGLQAARDHHVRHPFIEAGLGKADVRQLARELALGELAELPASPCLSSRIETGINVEPDILIGIDRLETEIRLLIDAETIRCRKRQGGVMIELDEASLSKLSPSEISLMHEQAKKHFSNQPISISAYRQGSAFLGAKEQHG